MSIEEIVPGSDGTIALPYPLALYACVGQVAVFGARVEGALVRLLRQLDPGRLSEPHTEVMWEPVERSLRAVLAESEPDVAAAVIAALDWAAGRGLRIRRNQAIHDQYQLPPGGQAATALRMARREHWVTLVAPYGDLYTRLQETAELLLQFVTHLENLTRWVDDPVRRRLPPPQILGVE